MIVKTEGKKEEKNEEFLGYRQATLHLKRSRPLAGKTTPVGVGY